MPQYTRRAFNQTAAAAMLAAAVPYKAHAEDAPVARTRSGPISGSTQAGVHVFKGVPYGTAARFKPATAVAPWRDTRATLEYGPAAMQNKSALFTDPAMSEDCLVLNVWTRGLADRGKRPVMVWLHGGGFSTLSGSAAMYDGTNLALRGDVVVVTLNHRLNVFGFLHLGDLDAAYADSGNVGMLDIVLALRWVKDNIAAFGGDAGNVTIFGESGGGRKASTLLAMPAAKGLFHRAIIQSGPGIHLQPRDKAAEMTLALLDELRIKPSELNKLDTVDAAALLAAYEAVESRLDPNSRIKGRFEQRGFVPAVGTEALPYYAFDPVATPRSANVPLLIGTNRHEMALWARGEPKLYQRTLTEAELRQRIDMMASGSAERVLASYKTAFPKADPALLWILMTTDRTYWFDSVTLAQRKAALGKAATFMYRFETESTVDPKLLSHHALEIPFVFDNTHATPWTKPTDGVKALAARMSEAWIAFARTGNPSTQALGTWPAYAPPARSTMVFNTKSRLVDDPDAALRRLWATI